MIHYRLLKTRWGILAYLSRNDKLIKIILPPAPPIVSLSPDTDITQEPDLLPSLAKDLSAYFQGQPIAFSTKCDLDDLTDFTRNVLSATVHIPYGRTASYGEIARRIGRPKSFRAVARALSVNPIPIVIPCHRVICSNGQLGGYSGSTGPAFKKRLLEMEHRQ